MTLVVLTLGIILIGIGFLSSFLRRQARAREKRQWVEKRHYTLLRILVPRQNDKTPFAAEQVLAALHGIYRKAEVLQDHFSFEIAATNQSINFYVLVPTILRDFIEGQIYSQYPTVEIEVASDYSNISLEGRAFVGAEIVLTKSDIFPIRTFPNFDVDPLAGMTGVLSKIDEGGLLAIQGVMSPIGDSWYEEGTAYVQGVKAGRDVSPPPPLLVQVGRHGAGVAGGIAQGIAQSLFRPQAEAPKEEKKEVKLSGPQEVALKAIEAKVTKLGYAVALRLLAVAPTVEIAQGRVEAVVGSLKQFNLANLNSFAVKKITSDDKFFRTFRSRNLGEAIFRLNVEEIASLFHFPDTSVVTPNIVWAGSKKGEPPQNLPIEGEIDPNELTSFGQTSFRNRRAKFGIKKEDRRLHFYIIGKTGTGKTTLIETMICDDIKEGRGVAVVDPHGELIDHILRFIPEERINDVVYFNADDREYPLAFNLLESVEGDMRNLVTSGLMSIFTKLWANVWSARMEYILRNSILAVLEVPNSTLLSVMRLLSDPEYRKYVLSCVSDPVIKDFFINEYERYDAKFRQEAIAPIQNKVGQFLSSTTIRNIVGQPRSTFNLTEIMDEGKILLVNLSIGRIGEDNSKLLGSMMITKMQLAAMGRARIPEAERRDFYLYVDEFQNFATDSFAVILSEARKYRLNLTLVNQYIAQIPEVVADAVFGNVGTMVTFRVGADDATRLVTQFQPAFDLNDLVNLPNYQIYIKMAIDGVTSQAFSAYSLPPQDIDARHTEAIIASSRQKYARERSGVESEITTAAQKDYRPEAEKDYDTLRNYPFILDHTLYKEFSTKGGGKWYFGQPPEITESYLEELATRATDRPSEQLPAPALPKNDNVLAAHSAENQIIRPVPASLPAKKSPEPPPPKETGKGREAKTPRPLGEEKQEAIPQSGTGDPTTERPRVGERPRTEPAGAGLAKRDGEGEKGQDPQAGERVAWPNRGQQQDDWLPLEELS